MIDFAEIIARKQAGLALSSEEIHEVIQQYAVGNIPDYQMSALLMAIYFRDMTFRETADLVQAMTASGKKADLSAIPGRKVDKHSTGGVGDKVSLVVAPLVASLGVPVPMISGRGLGHTGGTLDKLESIPGFCTQLSIEAFARQVGEIGCALIGQSPEIVPADLKMYALRDVTGTVRSLPLIAGSILSKKLAEGTQALLLDVKFGSGAVFSDLNEARRLARYLTEIGEQSGLEVRALLTDMDQPLGQAVGNWLEVVECLQIMRGERGAPDLVEMCLVQAAIMLMLGEKAADYVSAYGLAQEALQKGAALEKFIEIARRQRADVRFLEKPALYRPAGSSSDVVAPQDGYIARIDALIIGHSAVSLGAGRRQKEDRLDYAAGIYLHCLRGESVHRGDRLATLYAASEEIISPILPAVSAAFEIQMTPPDARPLIISQITKEGEAAWPR